jgi:DNA-binding HxlR family transcriptional regulator
MPRQDFARLVLLFHHRWSVPVLAELHRSRGGKFITLVHRLAVSPGSLGHTLRALVEQGWVRRNPGHGHPLRPEYVLTRKGSELGPWCARIMALLSRLGIEEAALRKWSLPVLFCLGHGRVRFSEIRQSLPGLTPRSLALALKQLRQIGLISRLVSDGYPPSSRYLQTRRGRRLAALIEGLAP